MSKDRYVLDSNKNIDDTLKFISIHKGVNKGFFFMLLGIYIVSAIGTVRTSQSSNDITFILGYSVPTFAITGVFSSLGHICIICLTVFFRKTGYITSMFLLISSLPGLLINIFIRHQHANLPGIFTSLLTIIAITIIFFNNRRIEKYQQRMSEEAVTDSLTGLPNRFAGKELMDEITAANERFAFVSVDLNNFKSINDTMGHAVGDKVLVEVADRWKNLADTNQTGTADFVSRLSADEYSLIIRNFKTDLDLLRSIKAYKEELEKRITIEDCDFFMTACFGYAVYPDDADNSGALFSAADTAMHEIKRANSSNCILRYTQNLNKNEIKMDIERKIRAAIENDTILFNLQPQYDINHKLRGFEALARLKDADGSFISPAEFIPVAEEAGLIDVLDLCVFKKAAAFFGEVIRSGGEDLTLSINISVRHLLKNTFIEEIKDVLDVNSIPPQNLEIEITESIMIDSAGKALECVRDAKNIGIKVAIDDFGTGYSSLSYLNQFPASLIKIDKSFIDGMNTSEASKQYVATIISIGHILNLEVISEGVESDDQLDTLKDIGCDFIQGYIWGRPLPPEEARKLVCA
ncbi:MAG: bifunctional diguanylate cyclase/phosphodiesterase [Lachnospiraceae bacterium]|nr:bifunctional diguanylate cyclase/phosphodiesterase [Lachnospiraceae bacterium]